MSQPTTVDRSDWVTLVAAFTEFFSGVGEVTVSADEVMFDAGMTGLSLRRDGGSRSFMPLHGLEATWDAVTFDPDSHEVTVVSESATYVYRIPPELTG